jgi:hypothetical protein
LPFFFPFECSSGVKALTLESLGLMTPENKVAPRKLLKTMQIAAPTFSMLK